MKKAGARGNIVSLLAGIKGVGVAENPPKPACGRRGVGARGSSVKSGSSWAKIGTSYDRNGAPPSRITYTFPVF
jgi:hypothetical protein